MSGRQALSPSVAQWPARDAKPQLHTEQELPRCQECGVEDDNLWGDVCQECAENVEDTSWSAMRRAHGTW